MSSRGRIATMLVALAACPCAALGSVIVSLNNPGSTTLHEIEVEPGGTFNVDVNIDTGVGLWWVGTAIRSNSGGVFDVVSVSDSAPWTSWGQGLAIGPVNPESGRLDSVFSPTALFGPGFSTIATLAFSVHPATPTGVFALDIAAPLYHSNLLNPVEASEATPGPSFLVRIVPEPTSWLLLLFIFFIGRPR